MRRLSYLFCLAHGDLLRSLWGERPFRPKFQLYTREGKYMGIESSFFSEIDGEMLERSELVESVGNLLCSPWGFGTTD